MKLFHSRVSYCAPAATIAAIFVAISGLIPQPSAASDTTPAAADVPGGRADFARLSAADRRIIKALQQPTQLRFRRQRLTDVAVTLGRQHGIRVQFDERTLHAAGVRPDDCPVTRTTGDISLYSALRLILDDLDLACVVNRGVLLITTPAEGPRLLQQGAVAPATYWKSSAPAIASRMKLAEELKRPIGMECYRTPWNDALDSLKKKARVEIQVDRKALGSAGVGIPTLRITFDLKDVPFAAVLGQLVRKAGLTYVVNDDFILITTTQKERPRTS